MPGGFSQVIGRTFNLLVGSDNIRHVVLPDLAVGITLTAKNVAWNYGAWAQIAATVGVAEFWLTDIFWSDLSAPAAGYQVDIGVGGGGAEATRAAKPVFGPSVHILPVRIDGGTRIAGRCASSTGVADTIVVKVGGINGA